MQNFECKHCGRSLGYHTARLYCSDACKSAAYRARVKAEKETPDTFGYVEIDDRRPVEKAIETKRNEQRWRRCPHCWNEFPVNGLQKARKYCTDACKQAAYRARKNPLEIPKKHTTRGLEPVQSEFPDNVYTIVNTAWSDAIED